MIMEESKPLKPLLMNEDYEINLTTMMILPIKHGSKIHSKVIEEDNEFNLPFRPTAIIDKGCKYFGSSLRGRIAGTKHLTGFIQKAPITIDPTNYILFFPTASLQSSDCIWVSLEHILEHAPDNQGGTCITFKNNQTYNIPMLHPHFNNQLIRAFSLKGRLMYIEENPLNPYDPE